MNAIIEVKPLPVSEPEITAAEALLDEDLLNFDGETNDPAVGY